MDGDTLPHPEPVPPASNAGSPRRGAEAVDEPSGRLVAGTTSTAAPSEAEAPAALAQHPRYRVLKLLGRGGMGAVYLAEHKVMERPVALKVIHPTLTARDDLVERFHREVKAAARLAHPNVVAAYDAERAGDLHFLVMEYVEGIDLAQWLKARGPLSVAEACGYVRQAALGLQHAHEHHMVHRDIKPHNLMRALTGQVKVLDFGLALFARSAAEGATEGETASGQILGTPDYMAPEQADDAHAADIRSDIYSLGCTLYHLLSGRVPFPGSGLFKKLERHAREQPTPLTQLRPQVPPGLGAIVDRMMAKDVARRYQTPSEVAEALEPWSRPQAETVGSTVGDGPSRPAERRSLPRRVTPWAWVGGAVLVALLAWVAFQFVPADRHTPAPPSEPSGPGERVKQAPVRESSGKAGGAGKRKLPQDKVVTPSQWAQLFNARDLSGWRPHRAQPGGWRVEDNLLTGRGPRGLLFTERGDFKDFHVRAEVKINARGKSALFFRSKLEPGRRRQDR